jgi:hypothetical protein
MREVFLFGTAILLSGGVGGASEEGKTASNAAAKCLILVIEHKPASGGKTRAIRFCSIGSAPYREIVPEMLAPLEVLSS